MPVSSDQNSFARFEIESLRAGTGGAEACSRRGRRTGRNQLRKAAIIRGSLFVNFTAPSVLAPSPAYKAMPAMKQISLAE